MAGFEPAPSGPSCASVTPHSLGHRVSYSRFFVGLVGVAGMTPATVLLRVLVLLTPFRALATSADFPDCSLPAATPFGAGALMPLGIAHS